MSKLSCEDIFTIDKKHVSNVVFYKMLVYICI